MKSEFAKKQGETDPEAGAEMQKIVEQATRGGSTDAYANYRPLKDGEVPNPAKEIEVNGILVEEPRPSFRSPNTSHLTILLPTGGNMNVRTHNAFIYKRDETVTEGFAPKLDDITDEPIKLYQVGEVYKITYHAQKADETTFEPEIGSGNHFWHDGDGDWVYRMSLGDRAWFENARDNAMKDVNVQKSKQRVETEQDLKLREKAKLAKIDSDKSNTDWTNFAKLLSDVDSEVAKLLAEAKKGATV